MHDPRIPVAANVTGALVTTAGAARDAMIRQVTGAVHWVDCMKALKAAGADLFIEAGPGKVLWLALSKSIPSRNRSTSKTQRVWKKTIAELP